MYNITNSGLLVLVDNLKTKTGKEDFSDWLQSINSVTESFLIDNLQFASMHDI